MTDTMPVPGYEGLYEVSRTGEVLSIERTIPRRNGQQHRIKARVRRPSTNPFGHQSVCLSKLGVGKNFSVHRLVALAFVPNPDGKPDVNHIDGNPANNHADNLEWCTHSENMLHAYHVLNRTRLVGEAKGTSVLTESDVVSIREASAAGKTQTELSRQYGVDQSTISLIVTRKRWGHI